MLTITPAPIPLCLQRDHVVQLMVDWFAQSYGSSINVDHVDVEYLSSREFVEDVLFEHFDDVFLPSVIGDAVDMLAPPLDLEE